MTYQTALVLRSSRQVADRESLKRLFVYWISQTFFLNFIISITKPKRVILILKIIIKKSSDTNVDFKNIAKHTYCFHVFQNIRICAGA